MTHVAIDARIPAGFTGGVAQVVLGLAQGFRESDPNDLQRTWLVYPDADEWLTEHLPAADRVLVTQSTVERVGMALASRFPVAVSRTRPYVERALSAVAGGRGGAAGPLDKVLRSRGVDVVHLPFQDGIATGLPSIYHPHDLQHRHFPEFFTAAQIAHRERAWRQRAQDAHAVSVGTDTVADDIVRFWGVDRAKIHTVPLAPLSAGDAGPTTTRTGPRHQILYPAAFWPHKNHLTLVRAVGELRRQGLDVTLRLPGAPMGDYGAIRRAVVDAGLDPADTLPGYVSDEALRDLYELCDLVVIPSKFESASFPIWESFLRGTAVVAARTTALPSQVRDGGLIVDADDVGGFADAIRRLLLDDGLRTTMGEAGRQWAVQFTWSRTVLATAALYRRAAGHDPVEREETALVDGPFI